jgi:hypothetical protein
MTEGGRERAGDGGVLAVRERQNVDHGDGLEGSREAKRLSSRVWVWCRVCVHEG